MNLRRSPVLLSALAAFVLSRLCLAQVDGVSAPQSIPTNLSGNSSPLKCYITTGDSILRSSPSDQAPIIQRLPYAEKPFFVSAESSDQLYWQVVDSSSVTEATLTIRSGGLIGWVDKRDCLTFVGLGPQALKDEVENVYRKAVLINVLEHSGDTRHLQEPIPFYDRPNLQGKELSRRALFQHYYVFGESQDWMLLGSESRAEIVQSTRNVLLGWVPKERICPWNSREAIELNKDDIARRTVPCRVFATRDDLIKYIDREPVRELFEEDLKTPAWNYRLPRFPIVSDEDWKLQGKPYLGNNLYKVGVIGDVWITGADGQSAELLMSQHQLDEMRAKIDELTRKASQIEVSFVIDCTYSMDKWLGAAKKAVVQVMDGIQGQIRADEVAPTVRFSVSFYRDYQDGELAFEAGRFGEAVQAIEALERATPIRGQQPYEMVYGGIQRTLKSCRFSPEAVKVLVLIGDEGNDPSDTSSRAEDVVRDLTLAGGDFPVGFFAIKVGDGMTPANVAFTEQTGALARLLAEDQVRWYTKRQGELPDATKQQISQVIGRTEVASDPPAVVTAIERRFQASLSEVRLKRKLLGEYRAGAVVPKELRTDESGGYGLVVKEQVRELIRKQGLQPLEAAQKGVQLFYKGWLAETDPREPLPVGGERPTAIKHRILFERSEARKLLAVLESLLEHWDPKRLDHAWTESLDAVSGGDVRNNTDKSPQSLMKTYLGVKVRHGLLAHTLDEFKTIDATQLADLRADLKIVVAHLQDVYEEQDADYKFDRQSGTIQLELNRSNVRPRSYWWDNTENSVNKRAWIPREFMP